MKIEKEVSVIREEQIIPAITATVYKLEFSHEELCTIFAALGESSNTTRAALLAKYKLDIKPDKNVGWNLYRSLGCVLNLPGFSYPSMFTFTGA